MLSTSMAAGQGRLPRRDRLMPAKSSFVHDGEIYYTVGATARLLSTTATKVRGMMGRGELEWKQFRVNGRLLIPAKSIVAYTKRRDR